jgi:cobalt-zinc-cadmium efflux system protein
MSAGHDHGASTANERNLWIVLVLTTAYMLAEVAGGLLTSSLALISDAAHMFTDAAALAIALAAIHIAKRAADHKRTYGYYRFEIIAAAFNAIVLLVVAAYILYEAYQRFRAPPEIHSVGMLAIAAIGLAVNLAGMRLLHAGSSSSLNMKGAYLEVWSDMLGSLGVIAAAVIIYFTQWVWVDAAVAAGIGLWVVPRTWALLKESIHILLEGVPAGIRMDDLEKALLSVDGVCGVHDLHVWALSSGKNSLTVHLVLEQGSGEQAVLRAATEMLGERFLIRHVTVQIESVACDMEHAHDHGHFHEHPHPHAHKH